MSDPQQIVALIPRLRRYARALVSERSRADDLVQDTLERAWAKLHLFRAGTDLRAWLFTVMHNVYVNQIRAAREMVELDETALEAVSVDSQDGQLEVRDLERALQKLPAEQRQVLLLVALEDMSYDETARALGIPVGTVMSRLSRARERLRALMHGLPQAAKLQIVK